MNTLIKVEEEKKYIDHLKGLASIAASSKQYGSLSEVQLLNLMMSAKDLGISPLKAINGGFYIVNGKVCMSTALMADRIRKAGHSIKIIEMTMEKCVIIAKRKDNDDSLKVEYTMQEAALAGLNNSVTWKKFPKAMLYNRCMSQVARILFPDVVGQAYSEEERYDINNTPPEDRPLEEVESDLIVEAPIDDGKIFEDQVQEIEIMLGQIKEITDNEEVRAKLYKRANVAEVKDIPREKYDKVRDFLIKQLDTVLSAFDKDEEVSHEFVS